MTTLKRPKVIITGTGRAGTTFLVQLLTELGLDTGYTPENWRRDYHDHCAAGLEKDPEDPASPYVVKKPDLCRTLPSVLARGRIAVDCAIIPIRRLDQAAASRVRVGGRGDTPGGLVGTSDPTRQQGVLAEDFHQLIETLTAHDIPHVFLHFPRFTQDAAYTFAKLRPLLGTRSREQFDAAFARVARPELIHSFTPEAPAGPGALAQAFHQSQRMRRLSRRLGRLAAMLAFGVLGWTASGWINHPSEVPRVASRPAPAPPEHPAPRTAHSWHFLPRPAGFSPLTGFTTSPRRSRPPFEDLLAGGPSRPWHLLPAKLGLAELGRLPPFFSEAIDRAPPSFPMIH